MILSLIFLIRLGFRLAGGRTFFLLRQEESSQRRRRPWVGAGFAGSLCYSESRAAAELGAAPLRQSSPKAPGIPALLGTSQGARKNIRGRREVLVFWLFFRLTAKVIFSGNAWPSSAFRAP
jgi:hypothetical protein